MPFLLLTLALLAMATCKKTGNSQRSILDKDVQLIDVDGMTALSFRSSEATNCRVTVDNSYVYNCENQPQDKGYLNLANLGSLQEKEHAVVLEFWQEGQTVAEADRRTYTYHQAEEIDSNYSLRLDLPLKTAEVHRTTSISDLAETTGCQVSESVTKVHEHSEQQPELAIFFTKGFADAKANPHRHNRKYLRLQYRKFSTDDNWNYYYQDSEQESYFVVKPPAIFTEVTVNGGQGIVLTSNLQGYRELGKLSAGNELAFAWKLKNITDKMVLTISLVSDDKQVSARCLSDPKQQEIRLDKALLQKLPAGNYSLLVQVSSWQQVTVQGIKNTRWLVVGYDWRYARLEKN